ncbi:hypothetical protein BD414DRAFT_509739 [Trametes punicea]|nr:hypothetical protein BD414DRAFT_509739 [Trametes punicea]
MSALTTETRAVMVEDVEKGSTESVPVENVDGEPTLHYLPWSSWKESCLLVFEPWWLNVFLIFIPFAWASHWLVDVWGHEAEFVLCFMAIIPLQNVFECCGEQLAWRTGSDLGEFICITFKNCVEATLALILLKNCHLRLLQSTIVGTQRCPMSRVVVLHLLLVQGMAFFVGGSQMRKQTLKDHHVAVNPSLLMIGVLSIVLPTAFFAALDRGHDTSPTIATAQTSFIPLVGDALRDCILKMSRGIALMLLLVLGPLTCGGRAESPDPCPVPASTTPSDGIDGHATRQHHTKAVPLMPLGLCVVFIVISVAVMCVTAEFLVESIDPVRERSGIQAEWFGLVLLPLVSFLPEAALAILSFIPTLKEDIPPEPEAHGTPIDLSIQFTLWWTPVIVLIGWWAGRPIHLLFGKGADDASAVTDYFEVALLLGTCFLVNYVTADGKTNFAEGFTMFTFYAMLATATWFYPGQPQVAFLLNCPGSVADAVANGVENALLI